MLHQKTKYNQYSRVKSSLSYIACHNIACFALIDVTQKIAMYNVLLNVLVVLANVQQIQFMFHNIQCEEKHGSNVWRLNCYPSFV